MCGVVTRVGIVCGVVGVCVYVYMSGRDGVVCAVGCVSVGWYLCCVIVPVRAWLVAWLCVWLCRCVVCGVVCGCGVCGVWVVVGVWGERVCVWLEVCWLCVCCVAGCVCRVCMRSCVYV